MILIGILAVAGLYLAEQYWLKPATQSAQAAGPALMQPMPDVAVTARDGSPVSLREAFPGKLLVINFWASWCLPCRVEMPFFNQIYNEYRDRDVLFIGISEDVQGWPAAEGFLQELREREDGPVEIEYPQFLDADGSVGEAFGGLSGLPITVFVDREGSITYKHIGITGTDTLRAKIDRMLGSDEVAEAAEADAAH
jgi:thiol-disulfide isomerase/thioredoxin